MSIKSLLHKIREKDYRVVKYTTDNESWYIVEERPKHCKICPWVRTKRYSFVAGGYIHKYRTQKEAEAFVAYEKDLFEYHQRKLRATREVV